MEREISTTTAELIHHAVSSNPELSRSAATLDPRVDPDIEQIVTVLKDALTQVKALYPEFREKQAALWAEILAKRLKELKKFEVMFEKYNLGQRIVTEVPETDFFVGQSPVDKIIDSPKPAYHLVPTGIGSYRPRKVNKNDVDLWQRFCAGKMDGVIAYGLSACQVNEGIKAAFETWYAKLDVTPEHELRAGFLERLKQTNWLSDVLYSWRKMEDHVAKPGGEELSRQDALLSIVRIFQKTYFEPLGIKAQVQIALRPCNMKKKKNWRNPAGYEHQTGKIFLRVDKRVYGKSLDERADLPLDAIWSGWNNGPAQVIRNLVEELSHKFDHEVCKKYLANGFEPDSPWNGYARALLPQFAGTPGTFLYGRSYYMLNPVERRVEGLLDDVQTLLYQAHQKAERAAEQAKRFKQPTAAPSTEPTAPEIAPVRSVDKFAAGGERGISDLLKNRHKSSKFFARKFD